ncbi:nucleotidyltransferase domain-containing protein [Planctomycetota bacterium]|nr:nucleotidyltransferase domain-containing protein [Planctomycetota bacterium]
MSDQQVQRCASDELGVFDDVMWTQLGEWMKYDHHRCALASGVKRLIENAARNEERLVGIYLGGSIAKGKERVDSDVDVLVVMDDVDWEKRRQRKDVSFIWFDVLKGWDGYLEGRYLPEGYVRELLERGSEPARNGFVGAKLVWGEAVCAEGDVGELVKRYPEEDVERKAASFMAQLQGYRWSFWHEAMRMEDVYLLSKSALEVVTFAGRLVLLENRVLFQCHKQMMRLVGGVVNKPTDFEKKAERLLRELSDDAMRDFYDGLLKWWGEKGGRGELESNEMVAVFQLDCEMSWFTGTHAVSDL